jgi:hypothetical protein
MLATAGDLQQLAVELLQLDVDLLLQQQLDVKLLQLDVGLLQQLEVVLLATATAAGNCWSNLSENSNKRQFSPPLVKVNQAVKAWSIWLVWLEVKLSL